MIGRLSCAGLIAAGIPGCAPTDTESIKHRVIVPHYDIRIDSKTMDRATVSLTLPTFDPLDPVIPRLISRGAQMGLDPLIHDVTCDGKPLMESAKGRWDLPSNCKTASWTTDFKDVGPDGVVASKQPSLHLKTPDDWWVISGPSSLLRLEPAPPRTDVVIAAPHKPLKLESLPGLNLPPAYFVVGDAPSRTVKAGDLSLTYVADDLARVEATIHVEDHIRGIEYFRKILRAGERTDIPKNLTVVWLGVGRSKDQTGGAGGYDTLLANYVKSDSLPRKQDLLLPLVIVLHEQFHQIARGGVPAWVAESLANYYALKAVGRIYDDPTDVSAAHAAFLRPNTKIDIGLIEVQRQISENHDYSHYGLFYSQGAAFWQDIDRALAEATNGAKSLDDILPAIMSASYSSDTILPPHVEDALAAIPKEKLDALVDKYLKGPAH